jgi:riboflavin biosynthesis pyrimidine reductase
MRRLVPHEADEVDPFEAYGRVGATNSGRPGVRTNMVASIDGAGAIDGRSADLGGAADRSLFQTLRALCDVVLVGANTVRIEHYGPVRLGQEHLARRRELGLGETPPIAVITKTCRLDWESRFFTEAEARPLILTTESADRDDRRRAEQVADVQEAGGDRVDLRRALELLGGRGMIDVLLEGGPALNGQMASAGLLDEICLTISPLLAGGDERRILSGPGLQPTPGFELIHVLESDDFLFLRYKSAAGAADL